MFFMTPLEKDSWKLVPGFTQTSPLAPFSFVEFWYPFTSINYRCGHNCAEFCEYSQQIVEPGGGLGDSLSLSSLPILFCAISIKVVIPVSMESTLVKVPMTSKLCNPKVISLSH